MKRTLKIIGWILGGLIALFLIVFIVLWAIEWRPEAEKRIYRQEFVLSMLQSDTLKIVSWNTGYAGLGADMDFFMDGGRQTRSSEEKAAENLDAIARFLAESDADIILLQEVDVRSHRSYGVNQMEVYRQALPEYNGYFAHNYVSTFVPVPLFAPLGNVQSGLAIFSRTTPMDVFRFQYAGTPAFPRRLFDLKRCLLGARFIMTTGRSLWVGATHNSAYDDGEARIWETRGMRNWMLERYENEGAYSIIGGDWNQTPIGYTPSAAELDDPHFTPIPLDSTAVADGWTLFYDPQTPTARFLDEPLSETTTRTTIDYFIGSPHIKLLDIKTIDLGFEHSDHNPVVATFAIEHP